jgi:hypothetical protein
MNEVLFWRRLRHGLKRVVSLFGEASPRALVGELGFWFVTDLKKNACLDALLACLPLKGWICDQILDHMYVSCVFVCMLVSFEFFVSLVWTAIDGVFANLLFILISWASYHTSSGLCVPINSQFLLKSCFFELKLVGLVDGNSFWV